jgi:hypothetical protein
MILNILKNDSILKHNDVALSFRDRKQCQIFMFDSIKQDEIFNKTAFINTSTATLEVIVDKVNRNLTVNALNASSFNNKVIIGGLYLNGEARRSKLNLITNVYTDSVNITSLLFKWTLNFVNALISGFYVIILNI